MSCNCHSSSDVRHLVGATSALPPRLVVGGREVREDILPPGIYWQDLIGNERALFFAAWIEKHKPFTQILVYEDHTLTFPDCPVTEICPTRVWVKFQVVIPTEWDNELLGFPTTIEPGETVNTSADTASNPDFSDNCDIACQSKWVVAAVGVTLVGVVLAARAFR